MLRQTVFRRSILFCCSMLVAVLAFGQTDAVTQEEKRPGGQEVARAVRTEEPAPAAAPATPAASMLAMEERLNWMEENLRAYQDEVQRLRSEMQTLKASFAVEALEKDNPEVAGTAAPPYLTAAVSTEAAPASVAPPATSPSAAPDPAAPTPQTPGPASGMERMVQSIMPGLKMSGVIWLYDYKPFSLPGTRSNFDLYGLHLKFDRDEGPVGFHVEYRMRTTKLRSFFPSPTWLQEGYLKFKVPGGTLKAGAIYKQFGIFTDYAFYGGLPYFDGIKYNPEWGASYEGTNQLSERVSLEHDLQYFRTDARVNGSIAGNDIVSDPTGRRRNEFVARLVPHLQLTDQVAFSFGPSFEVGQVSRQAVDVSSYWRIGGEATLDVGPAKFFGEVIKQNYDYDQAKLAANPGISSYYADLPKVTYTTLGMNVPFNRWVSTHINYGQGNYDTPGRRKEYMMQPGLVFTLGDGYAVYLEYQYWIRKAGPNAKSFFDRSLNTAFYISF